MRRFSVSVKVSRDDSAARRARRARPGMMCSKTRGVAALPTPASKLAEEEARKLESLLHGLARLLRRRLDARARELRLNRVRCEMLLHVSRNEGISQTRLAQLFD